MNEDKIKEAFAKAKQDIFNLYSDISSIKQDIQHIKRTLDRQSDRQSDTSTHLSTENQTEKQENTTIRQINPAETLIKTQTSTENKPLEALKTPITNISTGNDRVSTDRQTDRQTDNSTGNKGVEVRLTQTSTDNSNKIDQFQRVSEIINSLDDIKRTLRGQIKKLTNQEMVVFTSIYQLEEEGHIIEYFFLSQKLNLTESSIRDYVQRIIKKGIPIIKTKENNKKVILSISPEFKKIASLSTIIQLRSL